MELTLIFMQVTYGLLVGEDDGLVLSNDLPPEVLPAWRQLTQFFQLAHPAHAVTISASSRCTEQLTECVLCCSFSYKLNEQMNITVKQLQTLKSTIKGKSADISSNHFL